MDIKLCSNCNEEPLIQSDELGATYRFICPGCNNHTQDILSRNFSPNEEIISRLTKEWNDMN